MPSIRKFSEAMAEDLIYFNLLLIPFSFILGAMSGGLKHPLMLLCFIPLLPYLYFLRLRIKKLSMFLLATWATLLIGLVTPHRVVFTVFIAFMCSYSVRRRTYYESKLRVSFESLAFPLVFLAVLYVAADYLGIPQLREFMYCQAVALVLLSIIYTHLSGVNSELELASASSLQPTKVITRFTNSAIAVYLLAFLAVLMLFRFVPFGRIAIAAAAVLVKMLRFLFSLIGESDSSAYGSTAVDGNGGAFVPEGGELPLWFEIIEQIMIYTVNVFALVLIIVFIIWFCLRIYRGFYRRQEGNLIYMDETSRVTAIGKAAHQNNKAKKIRSPIRRRYFKRVNKYFKKHSLSRAYTPEEIEVKLKNTDDLSDITPEYERERYGKV